MGSNNLGVTQLAENDATPEVTVNDALAAHDAAITETITVDLTSGDATISMAQFRAMAHLKVIGIATAGRSVIVPQVRRCFAVSSDIANSDDFNLVRGSTTAAISPGDYRAAATYGDANGLDVAPSVGSAINGVPSGGLSGQVLAKATNTSYDTDWVDPSGVDPAVLVPAGGADGQVLTKQSSADNDVDWETIPTPSHMAVDNADNNFSAKQTFQSFIKIQRLLEKVNIIAAAPASTEAFDVLTSSINYYTTNSANDWTFNIRGDASNTLNSLMATGECLTVTALVSNGATPHVLSALQIDGSGVTPTWLGAAAPSAGTANKRDTYTFSIIKTAANTYAVQATFSKGN